MIMRLLAPFLTGFALLLTAPAMAAEPAVTDGRADDAMALFRSFCVDNKGDRTRAQAVIGNGNAFGKKLPSELMERLQGTAGGVGWALGSPRGAQLLLGYSAKVACEVRIAQADEASVVSAFAALVSSLDKAGTGHQSPPEQRIQNSATVTYRQYALTIDGQKYLIALSSASQKVGEQQHLITFGFVS